jgi:sarcosine oxidase subunit alpha
MAALTYRHDSKGLIDRSQPLGFSFNGQPCFGFVGDTLASALLANDIQIIGRSLKVSRPRGINGFGAEDTNAFVKLHEQHGERTVQATQVELYEGLNAESLAGWPPAKFLDRLRNKEPAPPPLEDARHQLTRPGFASRAIMEHCDLLVIGSGPAGLAAALAATEAGERVTVVEQDKDFGGSLLWCQGTIDGLASAPWLSQTLGKLATAKDTRLHARSQAVGLDENNRTIVLTRLQDPLSIHDIASGNQFLLRKINAKRVVMATGAEERLLTFPNNDTPGIMRASAIAAYVTRHGISFGHTPVVLATNNDDGHALACQLFDLGLNVTTVVDRRQDLVSSVIAPICDRGINVIGGHVVTDIDKNDGIQSVTINKLAGDTLADEKVSIDCGIVAISGGWNPRLEYLTNCGGSLRYDPSVNALVSDNLATVGQVVGSATGNTSLAHAMQSGTSAGQTGAEAPTTNAAGLSNLDASPVWHVPAPGRPGRTRQWVDLRTETTIADLAKAKKSIDPDILVHVGPLEDLQLQSTPSRVSMDMVMTRIDPDVAPPRRRLPTHSWHVGKKAAFRLGHQWIRPALYPRDGLSHDDVIAEEMNAARHAVTLHDLTAVGKLEVTGSDAADFLDQVLTANIKQLGSGDIRYSMMLDESGTIIDHGIVVCLRQNHFLINTSPGMGGTIMRWMRDWHQSELASLRVFITSTTQEWANLVLTGPRARQVLLELDRDIDITTTGLPYLSAQTGHVNKVPVCLIRTGYTGDVTFEIHLEAKHAMSMWRALMAAGKNLGIRAMGEDALVRLAAEKGRLDIATVAEQSLAPSDISASGTFKPKRANFIGKKALLRTTQNTANRLQFVALRSDEPNVTVPLDSVITQNLTDDVSKSGSRGRILTSFNSSSLNQSVTLALVENGHSKIGEIVHVSSKGTPIAMRISRPTIFDPNDRKRYG